jgi:Ran-interacting Mog1 protein
MLALTFAFFRYHFDAIAHDNDALSSSVDEVNEIPYNRDDQIPSVIILRGRQGVKKFNKTSVDDLRIFVALYRLKERSVDLVLSLNFPMNTSEGVTRTDEQYNTAKETFLSIAASLHVIDFSLFVS